MRILLALVALAAATPAFAQEAYSLNRLLGYGFEVKAVAPAGNSDILYLQGRLPSGSQQILVRCVVHPGGDSDSTDTCVRVN